MKTLCLLLVSLIASASQAATLKSLDCQLSNGVTIKSSELETIGLPVVTRWGFLRKDFVAVLTESSAADHAVITLNDEAGKTAYYLYLPLNQELTTEQSVHGTLGKPDLWAPQHIDYVAEASCEASLAY